jgi:C1A family cysteine protease
MNFNLMALLMMVTGYFSDNNYLMKEHLTSYTKSSNPSIERFMDYVNEYNKQYKLPYELEHAYDNFVFNLNLVNSHDTEKHGYSIGINEFADMSAKEFGDNIKGSCVTKSIRSGKCSAFTSTKSNDQLPDEVDWREHNAVTPVKNQGQCGSCWSFSATGAMEGAWAIKKDDLVSFSEQQLVDCSVSYGDNGCNGGLMDYAFLYAIDNGICSEDDVPYKGTEGTCASCTSVASISSCVDVTSRNQLHLKEAVSMGPVSVAIEADTSTFQLYKGGVISSSSCGTSLDHGVLVVGYGTESDGTMYWTVKNSWGPGWGEDGYVKIARSENSFDAGICGIALQPSYPVC